MRRRGNGTGAVPTPASLTLALDAVLHQLACALIWPDSSLPRFTGALRGLFSIVLVGNQIDESVSTGDAADDGGRANRLILYVVFGLVRLCFPVGAVGRVKVEAVCRWRQRDPHSTRYRRRNDWRCLNESGCCCSRGKRGAGAAGRDRHAATPHPRPALRDTTVYNRLFVSVVFSMSLTTRMDGNGLLAGRKPISSDE